MNKYLILLLIMLSCPPAFADMGISPPTDKPKIIPHSIPVNAIDITRIRHILKHLGYPPSAWPPLEKGIIVLLKKIDFFHLKQEADRVKSDPLRLKAFVAKLGSIIEQEGYLQQMPPHPLVKLLTTSFVDDDISQVIFTSPISFWQKVDSKKALVACTAISQLGSIVLDLLDINVKVAFSPAHVFNCIPLDDQHAIFVDFSNQIFEIVDLNQYYYNLASRTRKLKDQYHVSRDRIIEINAGLNSELRSDSLEEQLSFLYHYIYISNDLATTPAIFINLGNIYSRKDNYKKAISFFNRAITIDPEYAEAYRERGIVYGNMGDLDLAIADISKAIELFPDFAEAYQDRGNVFTTKEGFDSAISDYDQAIIIDPDYSEAYQERGVAYSDKGDFNQAIVDYDKAIELDPYFTDAYKSRAEAYFSKQEYDKSWSDVHKVEDFGDEVSQDLLDNLKKAAQTKTFLTMLIVIPIVILIIFCLFNYLR